MTTDLFDKRSGLRKAALAIIGRAEREVRALRPAEETELEGLEQRMLAVSRTIRWGDKLRSGEGEPEGVRSGLDVLVRCLIATSSARNLQGAIQTATTNGWSDAVRALSASVASAGGFTVPSDLSADVTQLLRPAVAVRKLGATVIPLPHGNLGTPKITSGAIAGYLNENGVLTGTQSVWGKTELGVKKAGAFVAVSNDMLRYSPAMVEIAIKRDLVAALGTLEDLNFIRGDGTVYTPRGLRNWAPAQNVIASSGAATVEAIDTDLSAAEAALLLANIKMITPAFILSTRTAQYMQGVRNSTSGVRAYPEMDRGLLRGKPFAMTANIPTTLGSGNATEIYLADFSEIEIGEAPLFVDLSTSGSYVDPVTSNVVSAFSQHQTLFRVILETDLSMRHGQAVAVITNVAY